MSFLAGTNSCCAVQHYLMIGRKFWQNLFHFSLKLLTTKHNQTLSLKSCKNVELTCVNQLENVDRQNIGENFEQIAVDMLI